MANSDFTLVDNSVASAAKFWSGGEGTITARATWASATITFEAALDGTNYVAVGDASTFTEDGSANFKLPKGVPIRCTITGSPTAAYVEVLSHDD